MKVQLFFAFILCISTATIVNSISNTGYKLETAIDSKITKPNVFRVIEAESYNYENGSSIISDCGVTVVKILENVTVLGYYDVDFGAEADDIFIICSDISVFDSTMEVKLDDPNNEDIFLTYSVAKTDSSCDFRQIVADAPAETPATGLHHVYFIFYFDGSEVIAAGNLGYGGILGYYDVNFGDGANNINVVYASPTQGSESKIEILLDNKDSGETFLTLTVERTDSWCDFRQVTAEDETTIDPTPTGFHRLYFIFYPDQINNPGIDFDSFALTNTENGTDEFNSTIETNEL
ncbi:hypothetical protein CHUAL_008826 [Chamberlinius hualienensis]